MSKNKTIENQAKVIRELWSELQALKRVLIDDHPSTWREINMNKTCKGYTNYVSCEFKNYLNEKRNIQ
jgi:hypothetical protein